MQDKIIVKGARANNLKNIDVTIPRDKLVVMTGLSGSGKSFTAKRELAALALAALLYDRLFGWTDWGSLALPALVILAPPLVFALGSGWLLGRLRPWLLYVWMLLPFALAALPLPEALGLWNGGLCTSYPLTLGMLDPAFSLPAAAWAVQGLLLAAGGLLLLVAGKGEKVYNQ